MHTTLTESSTKKIPTTTLQEISHAFFPSEIPEKMTTKSNPVAIGTRGTVGSLIMQEMEYFSRLELAARTSSNNPSKRGEFSKSNLEPAKKKRAVSKRFIPSMCSMVEVEESNKPSKFSKLAYRNLKADIKKLQLQH
ncbi:hypothetical protein ABFS82_13G170700 [Erythranthe guttata]|uniref:Uncharacterized protein n=1 Tax=Erythranthe guttata TaxID=4155 RepID=A0A022PSB1_ERYGU|nr:hypothetical protein MIMGU_mgv1a016052mg [Erythranthe guttata]